MHIPSDSLLVSRRNGGYPRKKTAVRGHDMRRRRSPGGRIVPSPAASFNSRRGRTTPCPSSGENEAPGAPELAWLRDHGRTYAGRWVAVEGSQLVGEADSAGGALDQARASGYSSPFLFHVTQASELPFGGW
jgi:hypothetical protein